ncbi:Cyclin-dependent kinase 2-interacting protein [Anthophora plagiata]
MTLFSDRSLNKSNKAELRRIRQKSLCVGLSHGIKEEYDMQMINKEHFSPNNKLLPTKSLQIRSLTGSVRHIRDLTADIHAGMQQWNALHLQGITLLKNITQAKQNECYSQILQESCDKLEIICDALDNIVKNFAEIVHQIKITVSLEKNTEKLFTTWPSVKFGEIAESIYKAHLLEARTKRKILEDVAHYYTDSWKMLFLASWVHQPLLSESLRTSLESMLLETGHRYL